MTLTLFLQETRVSCTVACLRMVTVHYLDPLYGRQSANRIAFTQAWEMNRRRIIIVSPKE